MRKTFIDTIAESAYQDENIFIISGDAGFGVLDDFAKARPKQFWNAGIAEQNMISMAAGLALTGFKVFIYNIAPFVLYRCYEQVRNDICYQELPITLIGTGAGLTYAPGGMTHYSIEDIAIAKTLPNLQIFSPADGYECISVAEFCLHSSEPSYVRIAKQPVAGLHENTITDIQKPSVIKAGTEIAIVFHGAIASEALAARESLKDSGMDVRLISMPAISPINKDELTKCLKGIKQAFVVEDHYAHCGLGAELVKALHEHDIDIETIGLPEKFIHNVNSPQGMWQHFGIDAVGIVERVQRRSER